MTKLHVIDGELGDQFFEFEDNVIFLGRASNNEVQVKDYSISRIHLKIIREGAKYLIEDQGSRNGTWVDGDLLEPGKELEVREGAPIVVGNTLISLGDKAPLDNMLTLYAVNVFSPKDKGQKNLIYKDRRFTSRRNLELIYEVSTVLMRSSKIEDVCNKIMDSLFSHLKRIDSGAILWIDGETGELAEIASRSRSNQESIKISHSRTIVNRVIREGKAVLISDISSESEENFSRSIEKMLIKSVMCVPLIIKSEIRGVFYVHSEHVGNGFRRDDLFLLTGLSTPAALAIENGLLHSKREQVEDELREAHHELERRVEERTAELRKTNEDLAREIKERTQAEEELKSAYAELKETQEKLIQSEKLAALGRFSAGISHEIKNPLGIILGGIGYLEKKLERADQDVQVAMGKIKEATRRANNILLGLLQFARPSELKVEKTKAKELIKENLSLLEYKISLNNIKVKTNYQKEDIYIHVEKDQIQQVLFNILLNSVEAMPKGGQINIAVYRECSEYFSGKSTCVIEIEDTGEGISKENQLKVYEPFFTTKRDKKGTGLGLSISKTIVEKNKGQLLIESAEGKGTKIKLLFQLAEGDEG
jgi:signal transduction histidine kinase